MMKRAGFYIDGFNFYHAVDELGDPCLKWMSYYQLAESLVLRDEKVELVKFFSAFAQHRPASKARHEIFNAALRETGVEIILGQFKEQTKTCRRCGVTWTRHEEKESDVNVAIHLLDDCYRGVIDVAYIVSTDSDIAPAARLVAKRFKSIELVTVATPNRRHSKELLQICGRKAKASEQLVRSCLFPQFVVGKDGNVVATRPTEYDPD